ncbi:hypothetical protein GCM10018965_018190 [Nonomuraea roseola]
MASFLLLMAERFARKRLHVLAYVEGKDTSGTPPTGERVEAAARGGAGHECVEAAPPSCN